MIYNKTTLRTDAYQTPVVEEMAISTEQLFLAASSSGAPEDYTLDKELTEW